jgi:hypothetical protein
MTNDRWSGIALIAGSAGVIITLGLHPSGRELFEPGQFEAAARHLIAVHSLALLSLPLWFLGAYGLARRVGVGGRVDSDERFAFCGLVFYGFALAAMMTGIVLDGLVTPGLAGRIVDTTGSPANQGWRIAFNVNGIMDEAFVRVFLVASSIAVVLWSIAMLRNRALSRGLGAYGCLVGLLTIVVLVSGQLSRYAHLFGLVIIGQAIWFVIAGVVLARARAE